MPGPLMRKLRHSLKSVVEWDLHPAPECGALALAQQPLPSAALLLGVEGVEDTAEFSRRPRCPRGQASVLLSLTCCRMPPPPLQACGVPTPSGLPEAATKTPLGSRGTRQPTGPGESPQGALLASSWAALPGKFPLQGELEAQAWPWCLPGLRSLGGEGTVPNL